MWLIAHPHCLQGLEFSQRSLHASVTRVEETLHPGASLRQVGLVGAAIAGQQRETRGEQADLEVLAQESVLRRRQQHRLCLVETLDPDKGAHFVPDVGRQRFAKAPRAGHPACQPGAFARCQIAADRSLHRQLPLEGERQCVGALEQALKAKAQARDVEYRLQLERVDVVCQRTPQPGKLTPIMQREAGLGLLQRDQRSLHVAGNLQLLCGEHHRLLDLGNHAVFTRTRELLIKGFERSGLAFGLLDLGAQRTQAALKRGDHFLLLAHDAARLARHPLALGQALRQFLAQNGRADPRVACLPHCPAGNADRHQGQQQCPPRGSAAARRGHHPLLGSARRLDHIG